MGKPPQFRKSTPNIGIQLFQIEQRFPAFKYFRKNSFGYWEGTFQPTKCSPQYKLRVIYRGAKRPKVIVLEPKIDKNVQHLYLDGSLCLFYPKDGSWKADSIIAKTIIPWAAAWLYFYEVWKKTGKWYGEEAPHRGPKLSD